MELTFFGAGDAFAFEQGHNSAIFKFNNTNLAIDFPATNRKTLREMGHDLEYIQNVFISHVHEDHINGLQQFAHYHSIVTGKKPSLYVPLQIEEELWNGLPGLKYSYAGRKTLEDYFEVHLVEEGIPFFIDDVEFEIHKTAHFPKMYSYGISAKGMFYFSCDSNVDVELLERMKSDVKIIFQDCHLWDLKINSHASLEDVLELPQDILEKVVLMHYQDKFADADERNRLERDKGIRLAAPLATYIFD